MNVNFEYYKIFYYVAKYKNFTKAANALGNSQPNVTRTMNCLEQELHCKLFIRTNRGVQLTPEGEQLYSHVAAAMTQLQTAESELAASSGLEHGSVSIGATETALNIFLLEKLKPFHIHYPGIRLKIYNHSTPQAIRSVKNGEIDFAVVTTPTQGEPPLKEVRLKTFREILVGGRTFTALGSQNLSLAEVQKYPFICLGKETMTYQFYHQFFWNMGWNCSRIPRLQPRTRSFRWSCVNWGWHFCPSRWRWRRSGTVRSSRSSCGKKFQNGRSVWSMTGSAPSVRQPKR